MSQEPHDEQGASSRVRKSAGVDDWERSSRTQKQKKRQIGTLVLFAVWVIFLLVWLWQYASIYEIWQNIVISVASLILIGGLVGVIWTDSEKSKNRWRVQTSILVSVLWITSLMIWYSFYSHLYGVYFNIAVGWASLVIVLIIHAVTWLSLGTGEMRIDAGHRPAMTIVLFVLWSIFIIYWLLFQGNPNYWEHDVAIGILSLIIVLVFVCAIWIPWIRAHGEIRDIYGISAIFVWFIILFVWFQFFAMPYNFYQNFVVVIVSLLAILALSVLIERVRQ